MSIDPEKPKRVGRPKKTDVEAKKKGNRVARGRPKGDAAKMNEFKARILNSPQSRKVFEAVMKTAQDPDHPNFTACAKMVWDRMLHPSLFQNDKDGSRNAIQINITGVGATKMPAISNVNTIEVEDAVYEECQSDND